MSLWSLKRYYENSLKGFVLAILTYRSVEAPKGKAQFFGHCGSEVSGSIRVFIEGLGFVVGE